MHIADVTHFVRAGSAMDLEAAARGTTVYLVERRLDMLPKPLTEDICSLRCGGGGAEGGGGLGGGGVQSNLNLTKTKGRKWGGERGGWGAWAKVVAVCFCLWPFPKFTKSPRNTARSTHPHRRPANPRRCEVERLAFSVLWEVDEQANILNTHFTKSVIKSRASLTYQEAQSRIDDPSMTDELTVSLRWGSWGQLRAVGGCRYQPKLNLTVGGREGG